MHMYTFFTLWSAVLLLFLSIDATDTNGSRRNTGNEEDSGVKEVSSLRRVEEEEEEEVYQQPKQSDITEAIKYGLHTTKNFYDEVEPQLYAMGLFLDKKNPAHFVAKFNEQNFEYKELARVAHAAIAATKRFYQKFPSLTKNAPVAQVMFDDTCPRRQRGNPVCPPASLRYRTSDGSCNNLQELWWGSAMSTMQRFLPAVYDDGIDSIRRSLTGARLPSARAISDSIHRERDVPLASITLMLMQWGQFIDHDVTATGQSQAFNGSVPQCCSNNGRGFQAAELTHPDCLPIAVQPDDSRLADKRVRCLEFVRSGPAPREDCAFGPREQLSQVTSFIDASTIYGSSARQSETLRTFRQGLMRYDDVDDRCSRGSLSMGCFGGAVGDGRLSEQPALVSLHVVFVRLHNLLARRLSTINPHWSDERVFQESRKIIGAIVQHVTFREFLPIVLGQAVLKRFDLELIRDGGYYHGYDPSANPTVANEFSSAAYRFGHSLVQRSFVRYDREHRPIPNNVSIHEEFSHPRNLDSAGSLHRLLLGLVNQPAQKRDEFIADELTGHLFETPGFGFGMDLAALNIQRGRDHGIAPYVDWRRACALKPIRDWLDLERVMSRDTARKFASVYANVEDVDLFSGGLAEKPVGDGLVGPTFACIIAQQFRNWRRGDRFWYENPFVENRFSLEQLNSIRGYGLAQVLCSTLHAGLDDIQPFVMLSVDRLNNRRIACNDSSWTDFMSLEPWREAVRASTAAGSSSTPSTPRTRRERPSVTRINQRNRVTVNAGKDQLLRPLSPGANKGQRLPDNLTIVIKNNAVFSPVYYLDSARGSHTDQPHRPVGSQQNQESPDAPYSAPALTDSTINWLNNRYSVVNKRPMAGGTAWVARDQNEQRGTLIVEEDTNSAADEEASQEWDSELPSPLDQL